MLKLGIREDDVNEYFDIMDERVYFKEQPDDVHEILVKRVVDNKDDLR